MNLNMQAFNINTLLGGLDKVRDVMGVYQQQLLLRFHNLTAGFL